MITYPSKKFGEEFKTKFINRDNIEVKVIGFRAKIAKKQIANWGNSIIDAEETKEKREKKNIMLSMFFCLKLLSMHFLAVSHGYIMSHKEIDNTIIIYYKYHLLDQTSYPGKTIKSSTYFN